VQDEESCAVFGMPKAAIGLNAADEVLPLAGIPAAIAKLFPPGRLAV
jgi:two-component system chemotaxis response regulator CheB